MKMAIHQSRNMRKNNIDMDFVVSAVNWPFVSPNETFRTTQPVTSKATNTAAVRSCEILPAKFDLGSVDCKQSKWCRM
jgi:hypothetical protein